MPCAWSSGPLPEQFDAWAAVLLATLGGAAQPGDSDKAKAADSKAGGGGEGAGGGGEGTEEYDEDEDDGEEGGSDVDMEDLAGEAAWRKLVILIPFKP